MIKRSRNSGVVLSSVGATILGMVSLTALVAMVASQSESTGMAPDQRPWIVFALCLAELSLTSLFLLMVAVWIFGTSAAPRWARNTWWRDGPQSSAASVAASGAWSVWRVAAAIAGGGLLVVLLAAPLLGLMLGWLLNPDGVLLPAEAWAVSVALLAQLAWAVHLVVSSARSARTADGR